MAHEITELETSLTVAQVAAIYRDTLASNNRGVEFGHIRPDNSPFGQFEAQPEFMSSASVSSKIKFHSQWAIQIYVYDAGDVREVRFVNLGDSAIRRMFTGPKFTNSTPAGREKIEQIVGQMRGSDRNLKVTG